MQALRSGSTRSMHTATRRLRGGSSGALARPCAPAVCSAAAAPRRTRRVAVSAAAQPDQGPPAGCSRYTVELRRPMGFVLEQKGASGGIFVAEVAPEGAAARAGVCAGDQLISTSGVTYNRTDDYLGVTVRKGQEVVTLNCLTESFKTVSAAIGSHPSGMPVRLTLQKCEQPAGGGADASAAAAAAQAVGANSQ